MGYLDHEELIGHDALRKFLARSLVNSRHHAFLLAGSEHLGKDTIARAFVADCLGRPIKEWSDLAAHPDARVLARAEGEKNISIEEMRAFIGHFSSSSFWGGRKIGVICGAQDMSLEAANALLKTLEEPAGNALLVLVAHDLDRLPETIKSRCQLVRFLQVPPRLIADGLVRRGSSVPSAAISAAFSAGRPGIAVLHANDTELQAEHEKHAVALLDICQSSLSRRLAAVSEITNKAEQAVLAAVLDVWIAVLRDVLSIKTSNERYATHAKLLSRLRTYSASRSVRDVVTALRAAAAGKKLIAENINARLIFENIALCL